MALVLADRVKESTTTTGTTDFVLSGADTGFQTFSAGVGANNTTYYAVSLGSAFEIGLGTLSSDGLTLARTTVLQSSNADAKVSFAAGSKFVFVTYPADKAVLTDNSQTLTNKTLTFPVIDNIKLGYTTTATAAGTTTLTATSNHQQFFTGSTTQTIVLPVTSTLALGVSYSLENNSTGTLTVQSSGLNTITTIPAGVTTLFTCILTSGTTAASWDYDQIGFGAITGTGSVVLATSPTLVTPLLGTPTSGNFSTGSFTWPTFNQNTTGTASNVTGTVAVANGGTGLTTTPANGALDIGNGTGFTRATLTAGTGITVTNASGSITIANSQSAGISTGKSIALAIVFGG